MVQKTMQRLGSLSRLQRGFRCRFSYCEYFGITELYAIESVNSELFICEFH